MHGWTLSTENAWMDLEGLPLHPGQEVGEGEGEGEGEGGEVVAGGSKKARVSQRAEICKGCGLRGRRCKCPCGKCSIANQVTSADDVVDAVMPSKKVSDMDMDAEKEKITSWFKDQHRWEQCGCDPPQWRYLKVANSPWTVWREGQILRKDGYVAYCNRKGLRQPESRACQYNPRDDMPAKKSIEHPFHTDDVASASAGFAQPDTGQASGPAACGGTQNASRDALAYQEHLRRILGPWEGNILHLFFDREQRTLARADPKTFQVFKNFVEGLETEIEDDDECRSEFYEALGVFLSPPDRAPLTLNGEELATIPHVVDYTIRRHLIVKSTDAGILALWKRKFQRIQSKAPREFEDALEGFFKNIEIATFLPDSSFGVFLQMPALTADLVLFIIERNAAVQEQLVRLGFRRFEPFHRVNAGPMPLGAAVLPGMDEEAMGEELQVPCGHICGYNILDRPRWVPEGGWGVISDEHRKLVASMAAEFRRRTDASDASGERRHDQAQVPALARGERRHDPRGSRGERRHDPALDHAAARLEAAAASGCMIKRRCA